MQRETDPDKYWRLRDRPDDWSEAKAMAGVEMGRGGRGENKMQPFRSSISQLHFVNMCHVTQVPNIMREFQTTPKVIFSGGGKKRTNDFRNTDNSNYEPLGSKKVPKMESSRAREQPRTPPRVPPLRLRSPERPWYKDANFEERAHNHMGNLVRQRDQIKSNLRKISREERNDLREVTTKGMDSLKFCIKVFFSSPNLKYVREDFREIKESVDVLEEDYNAVMNADLKEFRRLREEINRLDHDLKMGKGNYKQIKARIEKVLHELGAFKTDDKEAREMADQLKAKALHMEKMVQKLSSESETEEDQSYKDAFKEAMANFIRESIAEFFRNRPLLLEENVAKFLKITYDAEVAKHVKSKRPWKELRLGSNISKNVGSFLQKRMAQLMTTNRVLDDR